MSAKETIVNKFPFPECWTNDVRMDVLFSPFRPRNVNPENYDSKMNFWKGMFEKYCEYKGSCDFSKTELAKVFVRKHKIPYGLQDVIDDMLQTKEIRLKAEFLSDPLNTWAHWAVSNFVKKPLIWGVHLISQGGHENTDSVYVHLGVLQKQSEDLLARLEDYRGKVLPLEKIATILNKQLNNDGLLICLQYLHCLKKVHLEREGDSKQGKWLVKIPNPHEIAAPLTEVDRAIYNLESLQDKVLKDVENLEIELKLNDDKVRQYVREGKKAVAKNYLRKKHLLESRIEKKHKSLDNVHVLLAQVQEAQTHEEVIGAYKMGSNTLKNLLSKPEMTLDSIDEVMTNVKEAIDINDEIQQSISTVTTDSAEDSALEKELNDLLNIEKQQLEIDAMQTEVDSSLKTKDQILLQEDDGEDLLAQLEKLEIETAMPSEPQKSAKQFQIS